MRLLYFAWLKTSLGTSEEQIEPPGNVRDVRGLIDWLKGRDAKFAEAFADEEAIRVAVNHDYARPADPVRPGDEVAFFPPVTGG
jgi:molybdopterin converting factor subunit 1